jgi:Holliday junction DNA helicase RuvA
MYAYLKGNLTAVNPTHVYLECNGMGFFINISLTTFAQLENQTNVKLFVHLVVREDAHTLYGFYTEEEKNMFLHLISVSGVGPNTARLVLSSMNVHEFQKAILHEDVRLIQSIKGIGPKSAQRLILELKDKLKKEPLQDNILSGIAASSNSLITDEAIAALNMLGFQKAAAEKAVQKALKEHHGQPSVEELIKLSLKNL